MNEKIGMCKGSPLNKHETYLFHPNEMKSKDILYSIYLDVRETMISSSLIGRVYNVSLIDYSSCKTWIYFMKTEYYFMKTEYEVLFKFKQYEALIENQIGNNI